MLILIYCLLKGDLKRWPVLSLKSQQRRIKDTTVTRYEINALLSMGLADLAKKKLPIVYGDLAEELDLKNAHYNTFNRPLEQITAFCKDKGLPLIHLVVRQNTELPASVKFKNHDNNVKQHNVELEKHKENVKKNSCYRLE